MLPSSAGVVLIQKLMKSRTMDGSSPTRFTLHSPSLSGLLPCPPVGGRGGGGGKATPPSPHFREALDLPAVPDKALQSAPTFQKASISPWPWREQSITRPRAAVVDQGHKKSSEHDNTVNRKTNRDGSSSLLSVGSVGLKKAKARRKVREPRFCFKTMSEVDILDDGYKWRKYGQKVVKNTHHPRSYYRCTQDNCRVKKRVERLAEDSRMVMTTYEGRHVHSPPQDNEDKMQAASSLQMSTCLLW